MQKPPTLFKKKIIPYTVAQTGLLCFLLILSFALRLILFPLSYLESTPIYYTVAFFLLYEMLQFFHITQKADHDGRNVMQIYGRMSWLRLLISIVAGALVSILLSEHKVFMAILFLAFFLAETAFDIVFFSRFIKE